MPTGLRTATGWHTRSSSMRPRADDPALFKPHQHEYAGVLRRTIRNRRAVRRATSLPLCHFVASGIAASRSTSEGVPPVRGSTTARQPRSRARRPSVEQVVQPRSRRQNPSPELLVLGRDITEHAIEDQAPGCARCRTTATANSGVRGPQEGEDLGFGYLLLRTPCRERRFVRHLQLVAAPAKQPDRRRRRTLAATRPSDADSDVELTRCEVGGAHRAEPLRLDIQPRQVQSVTDCDKTAARRLQVFTS